MRHLEELSRTDAITMLRSASVGRVGVTISALPAILPVNYEVLDEAIVFWTAAGTKLDAAVRNRVVAFEVDATDPHAKTGWSVLVVGRAHDVTDPVALDRAHALRLDAWAPGPLDRLVRIPLEIVTGRRIEAPAADRLPDV